MRQDQTRPKYLSQTRRLVLAHLQSCHAKVYLFGSWATGKARRTSDIDVAVLPRRPLAPDVLPMLREALEESAIPYRVEIVDLSEADKTFRVRVLREGILWNA